MQQKWFAEHPELQRRYLQEREKLLTLDREQQNGSSQKPASASIYTIPVVFHILHTGGNENISDAQVIDAVNILSRDFNKLNADTANVVQPFKNLIGNAKVHFQLASRDPLGNCTNGIIRHWDPVTHNWTGNFGDYIYSWPSNQYLNIYVVKLIGFNAAGYTYLPGSGVPPSADAIVVLSGYVGSMGTSNPGLSRVLTHEVGHWLNLEHTWGWNSVGQVCGDDGISDTPITRGWTSCNLWSNAVCNPGAAENVQNYMDYAYCENMFTLGQAAWMQNTFNFPFFGRDYLSDPLNLLQTGILNPAGGCQPFLDIKAIPGNTICSGVPLSLRSYTWNAIPSSYQWSASNAGAAIASPGSASTTVIFNTAGTVTITCLAGNTNGSDQESMVITVLNGVPDISANSSESFESPSSILPAGWTIINPTTPAEKWMLSGLDGMNGTKCLYVPGEDLSGGTVELLESPSYDFKNNPGAIFSFKCAYARFNSQHNDVVKLQATKNCGSSWTDIWVPGVAGLAQGSGGVSSLLFHPANNQWKTVNVTSHPNFLSFLDQENVRFRFYFKEDSVGNGHGNRFYLDDISFSSPTGVSEIARQLQLRIYPNPVSERLMVELELEQRSDLELRLLNTLGAELIKGASETVPAGHFGSAMQTGVVLPGVYFLEVRINGSATFSKIVIE